MGERPPFSERKWAVLAWHVSDSALPREASKHGAKQSGLGHAAGAPFRGSAAKAWLLLLLLLL